MKVYEVFVDLEYEGTIQYGIFSTPQKARAWIRKSAYNSIRSLLKDSRSKERSLSGLGRILLDDKENYLVQEWELDTPPMPVRYRCDNCGGNITIDENGRETGHHPVC